MRIGNLETIINGAKIKRAGTSVSVRVTRNRVQRSGDGDDARGGGADNPAGAAVALSVLAELGAGSRRRVVVTPGMVELGRLQQAENMELARSVAAVATDLVVVGRTNRRALLQGARKSGSRNSGGQKQARQKRGVESHLELSVVQVDTREAAVDWVQANVGAGDVVLFENDLPDHYP